MKAGRPSPGYSELLILPDGQVLAHSITPELAALLSEMDPENQAMKERAAHANAKPLNVDKPFRNDK